MSRMCLLVVLLWLGGIEAFCCEMCVMGSEPQRPIAAKRTLVTAKVFCVREAEVLAAKVEPWIREELDRRRAPVVSESWIPLTLEKRRLLTQEQGGCIDASFKHEESGVLVTVEGSGSVAIKTTLRVSVDKPQFIELTDEDSPSPIYFAVAVDLGIEEPIDIQLIGMVRAGIIAIGGETTGIVLSGSGGEWELDLGANMPLRQRIEGWDGKQLRLDGTLHRKAGVEIRER